MGIKRYNIGAFETNTYLITKGDKAVVVDPGLGFDTILDEVNKYNVIAILITHAHVDHIDGCGMIDAPIYVGNDDLSNFTDLTKSLYYMTGIKPTYNASKLNLIGVSDNDIINIEDFSFKVIHTPGHTMGSCCYLYYDNLFSGDTLFSGSIGRVDFPGGSMKKMKESLKKLKTICSDDTVVYPGHDEKTTFKTEKKTNMYLINL